MAMPIRRKSLLIGINYAGSQHQLSGCVNDVENVASFLMSRGYRSDPRDMVILTDARRGPYYANGHNILAAMDWLVSEPGCYLFLHYSGHGGQVADPDGDRTSGYDDTIVPVDFEVNGQISSDVLHRRLVSRLPQNSVLFVIFDCCHSGSALELPFVYRTDEDGNVGLVDNLRQGFELVGEASHLIQGGFRMDNLGEAKHLLAGATSFFHSLKHEFEGNDDSGYGPDGLQLDDEYVEDWANEGKSVFMFSGCRDEQTSADAFINGKHVGAMSWAFLETMRQDTQWNMSFVEILQRTRWLLQQHYQQVPQLSCGYQFDLNKSMRI